MKEMVPTAYKLQAEQVNRAIHAAQDTAHVAMSMPNANTYAEATELALVSYKRFSDMQKNWAAQWTDWWAYAGTLDGADTVPKFMERSGNIALRAQAQLMSQLNDMSNLTENLGVSYSYWIHQQLDKTDT